MECPHCHNELELNSAPVYNVDTYGRPVIAVALCCGKGVRLSPIRSVRVDPYIGDHTEDDWGNPIEPTPR